MSDNLEFELEDLLKQVASQQKIKNYKIDFDRTSLRGDGFLSEFFLGSVTNKDTNETINCAIKKAFKNETRRAATNMAVAYQVENNFYSAIFPALDELQKERKVAVPFTQLPKYFFGRIADCNEAIVMENIKLLGYSLRDRQGLLDDEHARHIFSTYGKFHGLGFALKDQKVEVFKKVTDVEDYFGGLGDTENFSTFLNNIMKIAMEYIDADVIAKYPHYKENIAEVYRESAKYKGEHHTVTQGDCWSNNMMFKYNEDKSLADMKLLDFQLSRAASPVFDLSYFFYTGGSRELLLKLDEYLKIYHESLSQFVRELGSDPEKLYPFETLKEEWKQYAKFGVVFSIMVTKMKLLDEESVKVLTDDGREPDEKDFEQLNGNEELFRERVVDIFTHAHETGIL